MDNFGKIILAVILFVVVARSCSTCSDNSRSYQQQTRTTQTYQKTALDNLIRDLNEEPIFSIVLYDMDFEESSFGSDAYRHKYQVIIPPKTEDGEVSIETKNWVDVPASFFQKNANNMGMEIASKTDGKLSKTAAPAGYSQYVGNPQYGHWQQRNGSSFWEFYGRYSMLNSVFNMMRPVNRRYYDDYRGNYRGSSRPYYGSSGGASYGTSSTMKNRGTTSNWSTIKQSSFKTRVQSQVSRSSSQPTRRSSTTSSRTSRSSSRYRSSSSTRSRSGGFGK